MKVEYTKQIYVSRVVDLDEFWLEELSRGICQADKNWHHYLETGEPYCYGRNNMYLNFYYAETSKQQVFTQTIIPKEVWDIPNRAFARLIGFMK
jgi:hypothetical protein